MSIYVAQGLVVRVLDEVLHNVVSDEAAAPSDEAFPLAAREYEYTWDDEAFLLAAREYEYTCECTR